jgi:hypothetical protein
VLLSGNYSSSKIWRRLLKIRDIAENNIGFILRSGSSSFWFDDWARFGKLFNWNSLVAQPGQTVSQCSSNGFWNVQLINHLLDPMAAHKASALLPPLDRNC